MAVGAGRWRIVRQLLMDSLMLSLAGGVLGPAAGFAGIRAILSLSPANIPRIGLGGSNVGLDWRAFAFGLALSLFTGILFASSSSAVSRTDLSNTLKESSSRSGTSLGQNKTRSLLVTAEIALALVLMVGAALLIRAFIAIRQVNPGFDAHNVVTAHVSLTGPQFEKSAAVAQVIREGVRRIRALPGVDAAGTTCCVPLEDIFGQSLQIPGRPEGPASRGGAVWTLVSAGYSRHSGFRCCVDGLMAYSVAQRSHEIGVRLALGAGVTTVRNMVIVQGLRLALAGVVIGLAAALGLTRLIASFLFGVKAWEPLVFVLVPVILVGVALVAVWLPAIRASRVDPIHALRYE